MKIKLHNKFQILLNGKEYTAYNTILKSIFNKIANLEQYADYIALGTGISEKSFDDTNKLNNFIEVYKTQTEQIQSDITKGDLFIKKVLIFGQDNDSTFSFSELGISDSEQDNPDIFNHVVLKNAQGEVVTLTKEPYDILEIRVTIFLELTAESSGLFVKGENNLIKQILGENLGNTDHNLYALRGENLSPNVVVFRTTPNLDNAVVCTHTLNFIDDQIDIDFSAQLGEGETEEVLIAYAGEVVLRLNTQLVNPAIELEDTIKSSNNDFYVDLGKNVKEVTSVQKVQDQTATDEEAYAVTQYASKLTDKINNPFDMNFTYSTPRFISNDGKTIAFVLPNATYVYRCEDYQITKINSTNLPYTNLIRMVICDDTIVILRTVEPYIEVYKIENNNIVAKEVNISTFRTSSYSFDWIDANAVVTESGMIIIGLIINNEASMPLVIKLVKNSNDNVYYDTILRPHFETVRKIYTIQKTAYSKPCLTFLTDWYEGEEWYYMQNIYEDKEDFGNADAAYHFYYQTTDLQTGGRTVMSQRTTTPLIYLYTYPKFIRSSRTYSTGIKHYLSYDGNYIIAKYSDNTYSIFNCHNSTELIPFEGNFPSFVNFDEIEGFAFIQNLLLVFTSSSTNSVYAIALKNQSTRIDNVSTKLADYKINYKKYDLIGSNEYEGVACNLKLRFN